MTIEITKPEIEALILRRLQSGGFNSPEDLILHALRGSENRTEETGSALIAAMQASPYRETEIEPARYAMPVREVSL